MVLLTATLPRTLRRFPLFTNYMAAEQMHSVLVECLFLGCSSSMPDFTAYGTASKVFGLIETLLSHCERYCFKGDGLNNDPQSMDYPNGLP